MTFDQIKKHYGTVVMAAKQIGYTRQTIYEWAKSGVPEITQLEIQKKTRGQLRADPQVVSKFRDLLKAA